MGFLSGLLGSKPDLTMPRAGQQFWLSNMAAINNMLGENGPFGEAGRERAKAQFASQIWRSLRGDATNNYSLAQRGITPSGADFGSIRARNLIAENNANVEQTFQERLLNALMGQVSNAAQGAQSPGLPGTQGWLAPLLNAGATLSGLGWKPFK